MLVATREHVIDVNVYQMVHPRLQNNRDWSFTPALHMAAIDRELQAGWVFQTLEELPVPGKRLDEHARLRLKSKHDAAR